MIQEPQNILRKLAINNNNSTYDIRIRICFITPDGAESETLTESVLLILESGIKWVQYRDKKSSKKAIYQNALYLRELTTNFGAFLTINDYPDIALAVGADGVHLGQEDIPLSEAKKIMGDKIIGISTHDMNQATEAARGGADYIGFGPVFYTSTKDAGQPKGLIALTDVKKSVKIPVIAIGGINTSNLMSVLEYGADGVAVSSGLLVGSIKDNARRFMESIRERGQT